MDALMDGFGQTGGQEGHAMTGNGIYTGLDETYDSASGMFMETAASGQIFYTNTPNGSVVNDSVVFQFPTHFEEILVTKDGEPYDYIPGAAIYEKGAYTMVFNPKAISTFLSAAPKPRFSFRIISGPVADMEIYNAPWGHIITYAARDGAALTPYPWGHVLRLDQDGQYDIEVAVDEKGTGKRKTTILCDTTPPKFELIGIENGKSTGIEVSVKFISEDVERVRLYSSLGEVRLSGGSITEPGLYRLVVYDHAGNVSFEDFELLYRMNSATVLFIAACMLLLVLLAAGVVWRGRRNLRTR
jgi:hypothetical protein